MRQRWAALLFLHWEVEPDALRSLLPPGLELDTFEGRAFVGLVPFTMTGVRPRPLPAVPGLSSFHEVNVRTYVHYRGQGPGVWFFSLDAANAVAVKLARWSYHLPYYHAAMTLDPTDRDIQAALDRGESPTIDFASERLAPGPRPASCRVRYRPEGTPRPAPSGTLEHFLIERYLLYACADGRLYRGRVHHPPYPVQSARVEALDETLVAAAGVARPATEPLGHFAREVRVRVYPLRRLDG
ncbi:MAG TPA: DUF2071 domain-containing protein [Isosphaeraceae bacterium]|nr:DUF2071 domain-containing protein [Isosphaeraceae bacterium]